MKSGILALVLLVCFCQPLNAGQLIIRETETAIIIEYTGDAVETGKTGSLEDQPAFRKLVQLSAKTPAAVTATEMNDNAKQDEKLKVFDVARKKAEVSRSQRWSGKSAQEKYD